ncbi:phosphoadenosine phosphosulfate reductase [Histidinibacterium lentulum]|uniref:Phosphoadenosine phosphosulfate reductase n=1 Tax=Histidinibacterium lentulum TaxID=2480588 RepID=A0A3N2QTR1_9RHOB|nr:phosphoadenosine phosphosulfate reductase [Histidinibacterium lentulum]ROT98583.1 phosphoadenosine phosphosulfate reductase [Histidinibacterium lentulum]
MSDDTGAPRRPASQEDELREALRAEARAVAGGSVRRLGRSHEAIFRPGIGRDLIVTFETEARLEEADAGVVPTARHLAEVTDASWLCMVSEGATWFRDAAVFDFFDGLTDEGLFDEADAVLFMGAGAGGYAAAAYSVAAPGAAVIALRPQATLSAETAGWDARFFGARRRDFEGRYGYAPDMLEAAGQAMVLHDPEVEEDAMHAALFRREGVMRLRCRGLGYEIDEHLGSMGVLEPLAGSALEGSLAEPLFWRLYRARRKHFGYLHALMRRTRDDGRLEFARRVCRHGLEATGRPFFRKRLESMEERLGRITAAQ